MLFKNFVPAPDAALFHCEILEAAKDLSAVRNPLSAAPSHKFKMNSVGLVTVPNANIINTASRIAPDAHEAVARAVKDIINKLINIKVDIVKMVMRYPKQHDVAQVSGRKQIDRRRLRCRRG